MTPKQAMLDQRARTTRQDIANFIAGALRAAPCSQSADGWSPATVAESVTTSGCPLITLTFPGDVGAFNITITRARK